MTRCSLHVPPVRADATRPSEPLRALIAADGSEAQVLAAMESLVSAGSGGAASSEGLSEVAGTWRLLGSAGASKFSPLLGLPRPIRPESLQLLGPPAAQQVGPCNHHVTAIGRSIEYRSIGTEY